VILAAKVKTYARRNYDSERDSLLLKDLFSRSQFISSVIPGRTVPESIVYSWIPGQARNDRTDA
jgi:hypothetical protein